MEAVETSLKIVALVAGGTFFGWKIFTGWLIINLKMSVNLAREKKNDETDFLSIIVTLEKGATDSIWLQHITARVKTPDGSELTELDLSEELKWLRIEEKHVIWGQYEPDGRKIALSPSEVMQISRVIEVPRKVPVIVDVATFGTRKFWPPGFQWRASGVALPKLSEPTST